MSEYFWTVNIGPCACCRGSCAPVFVEVPVTLNSYESGMGFKFQVPSSYLNGLTQGSAYCRFVPVGFLTFGGSIVEMTGATSTPLSHGVDLNANNNYTTGGFYDTSYAYCSSSSVQYLIFAFTCCNGTEDPDELAVLYGGWYA